MDTLVSGDPPPNSDDLEGWRQAIADSRLNTFRLEAVTAAFQDLHGRNIEVRNALAKHLSESIIRILRRKVGSNHPNRGEDIILRTHGIILEALLRPTSADGRNLRKAFVPRVLFRLKDAIASEARERRIPDETRPAVEHKTDGWQQTDTDENFEIPEIIASEKGNLDQESGQPKHNHGIRPRTPDSSLFDGVRRADQQIDANRILERVSDPRKRLAFGLFMDEVPYQSKREKVYSIAQALGISEKTARQWVEEVRQLLENDEDVKFLKSESRR